MYSFPYTFLYGFLLILLYVFEAFYAGFLTQSLHSYSAIQTPINEKKFTYIYYNITINNTLYVNIKSLQYQTV